MTSEKFKVLKVISQKQYSISVLFKPPNLGNFKLPIVFEFEQEEPEQKIFHIARFLVGQATNDDVKSLLPTSEYHHPSPLAKMYDPRVQVIAGEPPDRYVCDFLAKHLLTKFHYLSFQFDKT